MVDYEPAKGANCKVQLPWPSQATIVSKKHCCTLSFGLDSLKHSYLIYFHQMLNQILILENVNLLQ